jgi:hypothetical protein
MQPLLAHALQETKDEQQKFTFVNNFYEFLRLATKGVPADRLISTYQENNNQLKSLKEQLPTTPFLRFCPFPVTTATAAVAAAATAFCCRREPGESCHWLLLP